jgi:DNA-binding NarL/FixJ family response regulator
VGGSADSTPRVHGSGCAVGKRPSDVKQEHVLLAGHREAAANMNGPTKRLVRLTKRRRQVATLVAHGLSNREVAEKLGLTVGTVKTHLHAIFEKLEVHSRTELAGTLKDRNQSSV